MKHPDNIHLTLWICNPYDFTQVEQQVMNGRIYNAVSMRFAPRRPVRYVMHYLKWLLDWAEMIIVHAVTFREHNRNQSRNKCNY